MNRTERKNRHRSIRGEANLATHSSLAAALTESLKKKTTQQHRVSSSGVKQPDRAGLEVEALRRTTLKEDYSRGAGVIRLDVRKRTPGNKNNHRLVWSGLRLMRSLLFTVIYV